MNRNMVDPKYDVPLPEIRKKIYVKGSYYIGHANDDFAGGIATVSNVRIDEHLPVGHFNRLSVAIEERPGYWYNWNVLLEKQEEFENMYKGQIAHPEPDYRNELNGMW